MSVHVDIDCCDDDKEQDRLERLEIRLLRQILQVLQRIEADLNRPVKVGIPDNVRTEIIQ